LAFLAPYPFDFFSDHGTEPLQEDSRFPNGLPIGIPILLRRSAGQYIFDPIVQNLQRATTHLAAPDTSIHARKRNPIELKNSTDFHPTDVVNWRIEIYSRPFLIFSVDEITLVYDAWTLLAKFRC
jgi:hypothetical protein